MTAAPIVQVPLVMWTPTIVRGYPCGLCVAAHHACSHSSDCVWLWLLTGARHRGLSLVLRSADDAAAAHQPNGDTTPDARPKLFTSLASGVRPSRTRPTPQVAADPLARLYQQDLVQLPADEGNAIDGEGDFEEYETSDEEDGGASDGSPHGGVDAGIDSVSAVAGTYRVRGGYPCH